MNEGNYEKGLQLSEFDVEYDPDNPHNWVTISNCYAAMKQYDKALDAIKMAINLDPNYAELYREMALVFYLNDNERDSINAYHKCADIDSGQCPPLSDEEVIEHYSSFLKDGYIPSSAVLLSFRKYPDYYPTSWIVSNPADDSLKTGVFTFSNEISDNTPTPTPKVTKAPTPAPKVTSTPIPRITRSPTPEVISTPSGKYYEQNPNNDAVTCPPGKCWVNPYTKKDGTHVRGYCRKC